jgi:hypothetical protein
MSVITSLLDGLASLTEPYWLTLAALGQMISEAGAGTALVGSFLLILSLDLLRGSKGFLVPVARTLAIGFTLFILASFVYGDFLAAPARAAYSAIVARADVVTMPPNVVVLSTLGAASAGAFFMTSRRQPPRALKQKPPAAQMFASVRREAAPIDTAARLHMRQLNRNPKKSANTVRPARTMAASMPVSRSGRRIARFERV